MVAIPKPVREKNRQYIDWLHTQPSVVTGQTNMLGVHERHSRIEANHIRKAGHGGTGTKPSDNRALPFIGWLHDLYHEIGRQEFERRFNIDLEAEIVKHNERYRREVKPRVQRQPKLRTRNKKQVLRAYVLLQNNEFSLPVFESFLEGHTWRLQHGKSGRIVRCRIEVESVK